MSEEQPPSFEQLDAELRKARERNAPQAPGPGRDAQPGSMLGLAFRIGVEVASPLVVGTGIGYGLDRWLGTMPWFSLGMFVLGAGAGVANVYRAVNGLGLAVGYRRDDRDPGDGPHDHQA